MKAVIFDIDGTISDCSNRRHFIETNPKDWKNFHYNAPYDTPHENIVELMRMIRNNKGIHIILCTGRYNTMRTETKDWLKKYDIPYDFLLMRPENDSRDDTIIKKEMLDVIHSHNFEILFCVDDRKRVVDMWRANGILTLQCAEGNF